MCLVQQIVAILVVNLHVADVHLELVCGVLSNMLKNVRQGARNDTTVSIALGATRYRESLSRSRLSVGENSAIVAIETPIDNILGNFVKDSFLLRQHVKDSCELENVVIILDLSVSQPITLEIELYLSSIGCQSQAWIWFLSRAHSTEHLNSLLL